MKPKPKILVVEDNVMIAMMMEDDLDDAGYAVAGPVGTGQAALDLAEAGGVAMGLVDVDLLHGESGIDLARRLTQEHGIPCVFVTGQMDEAARHPDAGLGVLTKPVGAEPLVKTVEAVLAGTRPDVLRLRWFERDAST